MKTFTFWVAAICALAGLLCFAGAFRHLPVNHRTMHRVPSPSTILQSERIRRGTNGKEPVPAKKCFDFKDPSVYTYQSGKKKFLFKIERRELLDDPYISTQNVPKVPRSVSLPNAEPNTDSSWKEFVEMISTNAPLEWDLARMARTQRTTRLLNNRAYAKPEPFEAINLPNPPGLQDLSPPDTRDGEAFWITTPARILSFFVAYASFPFVTRFLDHFVTMPSAQLDEITSKFGPGISILYGTFVSLTLSILYRRQQEIQDDVAIESALLVTITRNLLSLFRNDTSLAEEAGQCAADQIRTLVKGSRGGELILLMYSDPYARMLELVDCYEEKQIAQGRMDLGGRGSLIGSSRDILKDLFKQRANRLSNEALALPSTHFFVLAILTFLIFLSYSVSILPAVDSMGNPPNEASLIFGSLATIYVVFYNFASDLNNPFSGVYQVRRSSTAGHLLELKWLMANHPVLKGKVDFEEAQEGCNLEGDYVLMRSPGLGDLLFDREDFYPEKKD